MDFKVNYKSYKSEPSNCGSDDVPDFGYVKEEVDGVEQIVFKQIGSHSQSEYINSFADSVDLKKIIERYNSGDISVLTKRVGDYIDTLGVPDSLLDAKLMIQNGEQAFAELPANIKNQFENDPMKFIQACQDGSIKNIITELDSYSTKALYENTDLVNELDSSNKKIKELEAQINELKGVKYE